MASEAANGHRRQVSRDEVNPNDRLAALLMEAAIHVKKGDRSHQVVRQCYDEFQQYMGQNNAVAPKVTRHASGAMHALGKMVGLSGDDGAARSQSSKQATSSKNAARVKADIAAELGGVKNVAAANDEWCEEHFVRGCSCKQNQKEGGTAQSSVTSSSQERAVASKPAFQRPLNPKSTLIANGWIEQQRRSKMRTVWKQVLASLVQGRQPGEETTLWIQREVTSSNGRPELEALHQIPVRWIEVVHYLDFTADNRFTLKVRDLQEEFIFRCSSEEASQNWVLTLRSIQDNLMRRKRVPGNTVEDWEKVPRHVHHEEKKAPDGASSYPSVPPSSSQSSNPSPATSPTSGNQQTERPRVAIKELRAIAHGAGVNTHGMERQELEDVVTAIQQNSGGQPRGVDPQEMAKRQRAHEVRKEAPRPDAPGDNTTSPTSEDEARARRKQEKAKRREEARKQKKAEEAAAAEKSQAPDAELKQQEEPEEIRQRTAARVKTQQDEEIRRRNAARVKAQQENERKKREEEEEEIRQRNAARVKAQQEEEIRQRTAARVKMQQEEERKKREEEERRRLEEERLRRDQEETARRNEERRVAEQRRQQEEAVRKQQEAWQQQQAWQKQQAEEAERRRQYEEHQRRQQEEAYMRQQAQAQAHQQWQQQHQRQGAPPHPQQQQNWQQQYQQPPQGAPNQQYYPNQNAGPPPQQAQYQQQQRPPPPPSSPINQKYAKMANQTDDGQQAISTIKHGVLVQWALQPPALQTLRPIEILITSIHTVFPPKFGCPGHDHFSKWKAVALEDVREGHAADNEKLKKAVRKLRFFLHPDKLPRDLTSEQSFMCKMLWDITSDAWEEHQKKEEDLGWMK